MRRSKNIKGNSKLRATLTREAARLMYEEGVKQYHTAKWRAAKNILNQGKGKRGKNTGIHTCNLPSNGEISEAVYKLAIFHEGNDIYNRLFHMRLIALDVMLELSEFQPRLIGSVSTGRIKKNSDIDLHIFPNNLNELEQKLYVLKWVFEKKEITINYNGKLRDFYHYYLEMAYPVELSIYPARELRVRGRSSTDGKPIERLPYKKLLSLIENEHSEEWQSYLGQDSGRQ